MARVSRGIWDEELLLAIPEAAKAGGGGGAPVPPPGDNPYALIKQKRLRSARARAAVEGAYLELALHASPPEGAPALVSARQECRAWIDGWMHGWLAGQLDAFMGG